MEFITLTDVDKNTIEMIKGAIESLGHTPIDIVIVGAEETRLEVNDMYILKVSLPVDIYKVMRETALAQIFSDPSLAEVWSVPPDVKPDGLAYELSLALLRRLVDVFVAKVRPDLVLERTNVEVVEGETLVSTLVRTLAVDSSVSLAVAGHMSDALRLLKKLSQHPIYKIYRQFWDFATANFKYLPIYNWLLLMYG
ncbi:conserved hypothetical protein [Pyrobaculum islandicum DSM 4184]|uniref:Uncharacterized protein n=1 Tax=Pyrobaculum islandicum (strain DSM 4184 / JCM 9189 / GEO3) TaxID=384616 RepID=A1RSF8_PYRIL|nr:hypothetical protein [Pyrobaculum islandicum]ABL87890.1 conserved hypothetical protein [Pyrobaculum islandicum DSM 4184]